MFEEINEMQRQLNTDLRKNITRKPGHNNGVIWARIWKTTHGNITISVKVAKTANRSEKFRFVTLLWLSEFESATYPTVSTLNTRLFLAVTSKA